MSKGIYASLSGAMAQSQRLETIANNIANTSTTGFKKDETTFSEYLTANEKPPDVMNVPRIPASTESFYDMQGGDIGYVNSSGTYSDFSQGALKNTGGNFDVAIEGDGFFEVGTPSGVRFTRNGSFKVDGEGRLTTNDGYPVLSEGQGDPAQRAIKVGGRNVTISFAGEVYDGQQLVGRLSVVNAPNKDALQKQGNSLFGLKPNYTAPMQAAQNVKIHQGFVEMSNINIVEEMTDMIQTTRTFEANQAAMKAHDQLDEKLMNVVPKLG
jgi:flagellar basal-body rod protein FlgF